MQITSCVSVYLCNQLIILYPYFGDHLMGKNLLAFKQRQEFIRGDEVHFQEVVVFPKHPLDGVLLRLLCVLSCDQTKKW